MKSLKSSRLPKKLKRPLVMVRRVAGSSMLPVLKPGQIVVALSVRRRRLPQAGEVVIVSHDGLEKIKRLKQLDKAANRLYVIGDNPVSSTDSRSFGWLPLTSLRARVVWPRLSRKV